MNTPLRLRTSPIARPSLFPLVLILSAVLASAVRLSADQSARFKLSTDDTRIEIGITRTENGRASCRERVLYTV